jgi:hypothetical protein
MNRPRSLCDCTAAILGAVARASTGISRQNNNRAASQTE